MLDHLYSSLLITCFPTSQIPSKIRLKEGFINIDKIWDYGYLVNL